MFGGCVISEIKVMRLLDFFIIVYVFIMILLRF